MAFQFVKKSLKNKITFRLVIVFVISIIGLTAFTYINGQRIFYYIESKNITNNAVEESQEISQIFEWSLSIIKTISRQSKIIDFLEEPTKTDPRLIEEILTQYNIDDNYSIIYLLNNYGNVLVSTDHTLLGENFSFRHYFRRSVNGQASVDFNVGTTTKEGGFYFSAPVVNSSNQTIGVIAAKLKPEIISNNFIIDDPNTGSYYSITDANGIIVGTNDDTLKLYSSFGDLDPDVADSIIISRTFPFSIGNLGRNNIQNIINNYSSPVAVESYNQTNNINETVGISQISNQPFFIVYSSNLALTDQTIFQSVSILILVIIIVAIIMFSTLGWSISTFLSPLYQLKQFAISVSQGNFDQTLNLKTGDEFEDLANVFVETSQNLKNMYQGLLDKVKSKTDDLSVKVDELESSKKAIINLLEDVEAEKEISQNNANDLQKFKLAVDSTSEQIVITDAQGVILYANPASERNTGYPLNEIIGSTPNLWGGQMTTDFYKQLWYQIKTKRQSFFGEITNKHKDNSKYIALVQIYPIVDKNDQVIFFVSIERDITKAKEVETMKNDFISVASHQLRTPLGSMRWNLEMLLAGDMGKLPKLAKDTIQEIYGSDTRMLALVNDLLNVSRIDQNRVENIPVETDIVPIIEDSLKEMKFISQKKKLDINLDKKGLSKIISYVDPKRFREVIQNVLSNAVKYNREGGSIKIELAQNSKETNISVSDTGMGISKKDQERIFTKFFRASNAVLSETEGSGLGLFVVKSFVESWGGTVKFTSEENVGTTIFIKLPVKKN